MEIFKHWKSETLKQSPDTCLGARKQSYLSTSLSGLVIKIIYQRWSDPSKDADIKLGHFLLVKLSKHIDIVRVVFVGLSKSQKNFHLSP